MCAILILDNNYREVINVEDRELIREWLKDNRYTQTEVARRLGVLPQYVSAVLTGRVALADGFCWKLVKEFRGLLPILLPENNGNKHADSGC